MLRLLAMASDICGIATVILDMIMPTTIPTIMHHVAMFLIQLINIFVTCFTARTMMLSDFVLTVLFTVTLAFSSSTQQLALGDNATVQSRNSTDNVLPLNTDLASFSVVNGSNELLRREFKRNRRIVKRNGGTPIVRDRFPCNPGPYSPSLTEGVYNTT